MTLSLNLDDRTYGDLLEEAVALIPSLCPAWTDHNPSDPGITLLELFAWLTEMLIYRTNRVPDSHVVAFLKLLNGADWTRTPGASLDDDVRESIVGLRRRYRAVTDTDYEFLAREASPEEIARVRCLANQHLDTGTDEARNALRPGHVSVVALPHDQPGVLYFDMGYADYIGAADWEGRGTFLLNNSPAQLLYIGAAVVFQGIRFRLAVGGAGYSPAFEYSSTAGWAPLDPTTHELSDRTSGWSSDGSVRFVPPDNWRRTEVNGSPRYWVRISTAAAPTSRAEATQIRPLSAPQPDGELIERVEEYLEPRRLLTARVHVVGPVYAPVHVELLLVRSEDARDEDVCASAVAAIERFLNPYAGGAQGDGWPFGREVYVSEIYELLEKLSGVECIPDVWLYSRCERHAVRCDEAETLYHPSGETIGLRMAAHHLPEARIDPEDVVVGTALFPLQLALGEVVAEAANDHLQVRRAVYAAVREFFHPGYGGPAGKAEWKAGRQPWNVALSDLSAALLALPEVSRIGQVTVQAEPNRLLGNATGDVVGVRIEAGELADVGIDATSPSLL